VALPLAVGTELSITGKLNGAKSQERTTCVAHVAWCLEKSDGSFRAGLQFAGSQGPKESWSRPAPKVKEEDLEEDHYEVLQVSSNAHPDTIHRVYRMLAQRYHPDNKETGDAEAFKKVLAAYRVLRDNELRAAFDARRLDVQRIRWRIFENPESAHGFAAERRKRDGILSVLYTKRMNDPDHPDTSIHELEDLLGCPRDHLQVSIWYLKEKGLLRSDDRARYEISAAGVDEVERREPDGSRPKGLITAAETPKAAAS